MTEESRSTVDEMIPPEALAALAKAPDSVLVDVRTRAEWTFTGVPDLSELGREVMLVEWVSFPGMAPNPRFFEEVVDRAGGDLPDRLFFICRSGARSLSAGMAAQAEGFPHAYNVADGFEGPVDAEGHRGKVAGWKADGLPWRQR